MSRETPDSRRRRPLGAPSTTAAFSRRLQIKVTLLKACLSAKTDWKICLKCDLSVCLGTCGTGVALGDVQGGSSSGGGVQGDVGLSSAVRDSIKHPTGDGGRQGTDKEAEAHICRSSALLESSLV